MADYEAAARFLFDLLDNINTAEDMAQSNHEAFRRLARDQYLRRFEVATTDGYTVTFH